MPPESKLPAKHPCPPRKLLGRYILRADTLSDQQCEQIVEHVARCPCCAAIYDALCEAEQKLWAEAAATAGLPKRELHFTRSPEESLVGLWRRIDEAEGKLPRRQH